jgi:hypothetical protein
VNAGKLGKRLRREIVANPKKATLLGVLLLVALYYWSPLVAGWVGAGDKSVAGPTKAKPDAAAPGSQAVPAATKSSPAAPSPGALGTKAKQPEPPRPWRQLVEWMEKDPRTQSAGPLAKERDPFQLRTPQVVAAPKKEPPKLPEPEVTLQGLTVVLAGTIIGPGRNLARINGKTYQPGSTIELSGKDGKKKYAFTVSEVTARRVVLERQGKKFELEIPSAGRSGRIELLGSIH